MADQRPPPDEPPATPTIRLDQLLKREGLVETGGQAKVVIQAGEVRVNDEVETRRKKKLRPGDRVELAGRSIVVDALID